MNIRKSTLALSVVLLVGIMWVPFLGAQSYTINQITNNTTYDQTPWINSNRDVVWSGQVPGNNYDIFKYSYAAGTTSNISNQLTSYGRTYNENWNPQINNQGAISWLGQAGSPSYRDVFVYSGSIKQVSTSGSNAFPQINNQGRVTWEEWGSIPGVGQRPLYIEVYNPDNGQTRTISRTEYFYDYGSGSSRINSTYTLPSINNNGDVVYSGNVNVRSSSATNIFSYNAATDTATRITNNTFNGLAGSPAINDRGDIAWLDESGKSVQLRTASGTTLRLDAGNYQDYSPFVGQTGDVVWVSRSKANGDTEVYLYDALHGTTSMISADHDALSANWSPFLDKWGNVIWEQDMGGTWNIRRYDRATGITSTIVADQDMLQNMRINEFGDIVWQALDSGRDMEIFLAACQQPASVPEPSSLLFLVPGLAGIVTLRRRFKK